MSGQREKIPDGAQFTNGVLKVQKDVTFGWVVILRDSPQAEEEAFMIDELEERAPEIFSFVKASAEDHEFPQEYRDYVHAFLQRHRPNRNRTLH